MRKPLIFCGAFNPPTIAHVDLAHIAMEAEGCTEVIFTPSKARYIREQQHKQLVFGDRCRLEMLDGIAKARSWAKVCTYELRADHQPRTYETLCALRDQGCAGPLLIGTDNLMGMSEGWKYVREIALEFGIVCLTRSGATREACTEIIRESPVLAPLESDIHIVEAPDGYADISSTKVRELLSCRNIPWEIVSRLLPEETAVYLRGLIEQGRA